jgi:hypothetical protein
MTFKRKKVSRANSVLQRDRSDHQTKREVTACEQTHRVDWRDAQVKQHAESPLMKRTTLKPGTTPQELSVVMMDGGRF